MCVWYAHVWPAYVQLSAGSHWPHLRWMILYVGPRRALTNATALLSVDPISALLLALIVSSSSFLLVVCQDNAIYQIAKCVICQEEEPTRISFLLLSFLSPFSRDDISLMVVAMANIAHVQLFARIAGCYSSIISSKNMIELVTIRHSPWNKIENRWMVLVSYNTYVFVYMILLYSIENRPANARHDKRTNSVE